MGIVRFFYWFKTQFNSKIDRLRPGQTLADINQGVDNLMVDMNGVFHNSAQKVYEYGNFKAPKSLLNKGRRRPPRLSNQKNIELFRDVCQTIEKLVTTAKPRKRVILCVDGPAPLSKQSQQRQRRFRSAKESEGKNSSFDSNSITPGTKFMHHLCKYIDWYIRRRVTEDEYWGSLEVIFSSEKVPSEGEQKCISYIRYYGNPEESYCINGMDADLIMLTLGTHFPNFYILREDVYDRNTEYFWIHIGKIRGLLAEKMRWEEKSGVPEFCPRTAIDDFIFLCFTVGNDFLPHIPMIEIIEQGIELILDVCKQVGMKHGHMTTNKAGDIRFRKKPLQAFLRIIGNLEGELLEKKLNSKQSYFPDPLVDDVSRQRQDGTWQVDIDLFRKNYCNEKFGTDLETVCHRYFEGMQWVLTYYTKGVPNWKWKFSHQYAPPASVLAEYVDTFEFPVYGRTIPTTPFQQLLCVLPPKSANLIPRPLCNLLTDPTSPLREFYPEKFDVDLAGKRNDWEGLVLLPSVDFEKVRTEYFKEVDKVDKRDIVRNVAGDTVVYVRKERPYHFRSYYGDIPNCQVVTKVLQLD